MNTTGQALLSEKMQLRAIRVLTVAVIAAGLYVLVRFVQVNPLRGDEFFSFMHSDFDSLAVVLGNVRNGADNTYIYSALLWAATQMLGHTLFVQRLLSLLLWFASGLLLYRMAKPVFNSPAWQLAAVVLVMFSAHGFFMATDGRMYALLFFCWVLQCLFLQSRLTQQKNISWWLATILPLCGLLVTPVFFVGQLVIIAALFLLWRAKREAYLLQQFWRLAGASGLMLLVFLLFFHVSYQHQSLFRGYLLQYLQHPQPQALPGAEFFSIPFRWVMLPHVPGLSAAGDGVCLVLLLGAALWVGRKTIVTALRGAPVFISLLLGMLACTFVLLLLQLLLHMLFGVQLWSYRYYTCLSLALPLLVCWLLFTYRGNRIVYVLILFFFTGCWLRVVHEAEKISPREAKQELLPQYAAYIEKNECAVFVERFSAHSCALCIYGELYMRYPGLRHKMGFAANRDAEWTTYFQILDSLNYHSNIKDLATVPLSNSCLILKEPDDSHNYEGHPVVELVSPLVGE